MWSFGDIVGNKCTHGPNGGAARATHGPDPGDGGLIQPVVCGRCAFGTTLIPFGRSKPEQERKKAYDAAHYQEYGQAAKRSPTPSSSSRTSALRSCDFSQSAASGCAYSRSGREGDRGRRDGCCARRVGSASGGDRRARCSVRIACDGVLSNVQAACDAVDVRELSVGSARGGSRRIRTSL